MAGSSAGGRLALDYAIRRPERAENVAASARGKPSAPDVWRMRQTQADGTTRQPGADRFTPTVRAFMEFVGLIDQRFRARIMKLPIFSNHDLQNLKVPIFASSHPR